MIVPKLGAMNLHELSKLIGHNLGHFIFDSSIGLVNDEVLNVS